MIFSCALLRSRDVTVLNQRSKAELDLFGDGDLLVLDEAVLLEVLLALLFLLGLVIGLVGGVATGGVAVLALNDVVILGLLGHGDFVNAPLPSGGNGANVQSGILLADLLPAGPGIKAVGLVVACMVVVLIMISVMVVIVPSVEWESVSQRFWVPSKIELSALCSGIVSLSDGHKANDKAENNQKKLQPGQSLKCVETKMSISAKKWHFCESRKT